MRSFRVIPVTRLVTACLLLVALTSVSASAGAKRLLSYYPYWAKTQTPPYSAAQIPYYKMTHIAHAFLAVNDDGSGAIWVPPGLLEPELNSRAHAAGVKVLISIGGASTQQAGAFSKIARSEAARRAFASNVHQFLVQNKYDGVDIDWEVPNAPNDTQNCVLLMETLREQLPSPWLISMAIGSDPRGYGTGFDVPALAPILDFINVMTYDMHGPWSNHAGHNSPLYLNMADPGLEGSVKASMDLFEQTLGVPKDKLNMGTAFYGYQFLSVQDLWDFCDCGPSTSSWNYGTYIKPRINQQGWAAYLDPDAKAPYLLDQGEPGGLGFITYDDATSSARKVNYVLGTRGFGGVFMWDLSADYDGSSQDLLDAMYGAFVRYQGRR